ncbi:DUF6093 family protein [Nocardioides sp. InS609-2]|uniref:DUF6093 family protein n=1 Tax=Nocardioides sp. InS609-2 TaxID=2760705 RepID=UPI0020C0BA88|nr:DUF6093 family protein [Nocardioides sp. InS609-2]
MKRHHTGSGRRAVIPDDWAAHHAPVAEGTMLDGTIALREPGTVQTWSDELERNVATPKTPYFTGGCRIQALTGQARVIAVAEDDETIADYLITVPRDVEPLEGHLARVTAVDDAVLINRTLRVERVVRGTQRFERDIFCTLAD